MTRRHLLNINTLFIAHLLVVGLVITSILPRSVVPFWTLILAIYVLWASLEDSTAFFIRSIPFFIAIPLAANFDSFNMWRVLSGLIFLKWLFEGGVLARLFKRFSIKSFILENKVSVLLSALLLLAILSVTQATSITLAVKRIIYFVNLSLIGFVVYDLVRRDRNFSRCLIKNIAIPTIIVTIVGIAQLASVYFLDIFQFVDFWAKRVELGLFGSAWANIALHANTWFAYYGDQLSLRVFSLFPDSHSFPIFLLLGLPAIFAISFAKLFGGKAGGLTHGSTTESLKSLFFKRVGIWVLFVPLVFLAAILSGTRGIWAASMGAILAVFGGIWFLKRSRAGEKQLVILKYISSYLLLFFLLFGVAYFIFASDQFQVQKSDVAMFSKRVKSVIDISETSNARRLEIWQDSIRSIIKHPLLGIGIGNFPVVVGEDLAQAKAGSSAHNLYLNIAAEMGVPALLVTLWFLWLLLKKTFLNFLNAKRSTLNAVYFAALLIFLPWVLVYSLTDVAIFDERAFLLFVATCALIFGQNETDREAG